MPLRNYTQKSILIGSAEISHDNAQFKEFDELLEAALQKARDVKSKFAGTIENFDELVGNVLQRNNMMLKCNASAPAP